MRKNSIEFLYKEFYNFVSKSNANLIKQSRDMNLSDAVKLVSLMSKSLADLNVVYTVLPSSSPPFVDDDSGTLEIISRIRSDPELLDSAADLLNRIFKDNSLY